MIIQWRDFSFTVINSIEKLLDLQFFTQISTNFQLMKVQFEKLDKYLEKSTIPKEYKNLANIFLLFTVILNLHIGMKTT